MPYLLAEPTQDVDYETVPPTPSVLRLRRVLNFLGRPLPSGIKLTMRDRLRRRWFKKTDALLREMLKNDYQVGATIHYYDHHTCHALTPVFFFGLNQLQEKSLLITADGAGGDSCSKIFVYDPANGGLQKIAHSYYPASLGFLYSHTTQYLGMRPGEHEYKVMGLAAYSSDDKYWRKLSQKLKDLIHVDSASLTLQSTIDMTEGLSHLKRIFDEQRFDNVAAAVQDALEDRILELTRAAITKTGISTVAFAGGVFMNVKMNQKIGRLPAVQRAFFQPSCGDESLGIGAAAQQFMDEKVPLKPIRTMYTGPSYGEKELDSFLAQNSEARHLRVERVGDIEERIARLLADHKIVARFDGRGEWGARSLCNRAILANASDMRAFYCVNDMVKMRDFWMPFAPAILMDWGKRYIAEWDLVRSKILESTKYMIVTVDSTPLAQDHLRAAIHQKDKTLRQQMVEESDNESLFRILTRFESLSGMGGVMNTSFNLHGFPLVGDPERALKTFVNSGLEYLALGNFLIAKGPDGPR